MLTSASELYPIKHKDASIVPQLAQQDTMRLFAAAVTRYLGNVAAFDPLKHVFLLNYICSPPRMYIAEFDGIYQAVDDILVNILGKGVIQESQIEAICDTYRADKSVLKAFLTLTFFKSPIEGGMYVRPYPFHLELARNYSKGTVPQDCSESWGMRPAVEFGAEKWECPAKSDLVDEIISTCCGDEIEKYWRSNVDEVAYQVYKKIGSGYMIVQKCGW